ncbi:MAG: hypothetical protein J7L89_07615 [Bacteroidales bacterium]|nr:hypothetical protein [Bacteroidales bacterium]
MKQKAWIFSVIVLFLIGFSSCNKNIDPVNLATQATNTHLMRNSLMNLMMT